MRVKDDINVRLSHRFNGSLLSTVCANIDACPE
jgi:hypothetical protein